jgi:hypothetical protein
MGTTPAYALTPAVSSQTPAYFANGVSSVATPGGAMLPNYEQPSADDNSECDFTLRTLLLT